MLIPRVSRMHDAPLGTVPQRLLCKTLRRAAFQGPLRPRVPIKMQRHPGNLQPPAPLLELRCRSLRRTFRRYCQVRLAHAGGGGFDIGGATGIRPVCSPAPTFREGIDVLYPKTEEIQKVHAHVLAGFTDAEENQVVAHPLLRGYPIDDVAEHGKWFDCVLCVIVIPRHSVVS